MSSAKTVSSSAAFDMRSLAPSFGTELVFFFRRDLFTNLGRYEFVVVPCSKPRKRVGTYKPLYWPLLYEAARFAASCGDPKSRSSGFVQSTHINLGSLPMLFSVLETVAAIRLILPNRLRLFLPRLIRRTAQKEQDDWPGQLAPIWWYWRGINESSDKADTSVLLDLKVNITLLVSSDKNNSSRSHQPQPCTSHARYTIKASLSAA